IQVTPAFDLGMSIDRQKGATVQWTPTAAADFRLELQGLQGGTLVEWLACDFASEAGQGDIPASLLALFAESEVFVNPRSRSRGLVQVGDYAIDLWIDAQVNDGTMVFQKLIALN